MHCNNRLVMITEVLFPSLINSITLHFLIAGSWHTRGHTSSLGTGIVIDMHTGLIVDYEVLSKRCMVCLKMKNKVKNETVTKEKYIQWLEKHKSDCNINYDGTSGAMEEKAAVILWSRSIELKLRYVTFVGDGDCSSYNALREMNNKEGPYGIENTVSKEECVNHVHKRMGYALRKLRDEVTEETVTAGGKRRYKKLLGGKGKITDNVILKLTDYYGNAIRRNVGSTVQAMRNDILATFFHVTSTDEDHNHSLCPRGAESWCFWQRASAKCKDGDVMPSHSSMKVHVVLNKNHKELLKGVYDRLTHDALLKKCLHGKTQNPNESLHQRVWNLCPKVKSLGKVTLDFAVAKSSLVFNTGYVKGYINKDLGLNINVRMVSILKDWDAGREKAKTVQRRKKRKITADANYQAGGF